MSPSTSPSLDSPVQVPNLLAGQGVIDPEHQPLPSNQDPRFFWDPKFFPLKDGVPDKALLSQFALPPGHKLLCWWNRQPVVSDKDNRVLALTTRGPQPLSDKALDLKRNGLARDPLTGRIHSLDEKTDSSTALQMPRLSDDRPPQVQNMNAMSSRSSHIAGSQTELDSKPHINAEDAEDAIEDVYDSEQDGDHESVTLSEWDEYGSEQDGDHESVTLSEWYAYGSDRDGDHESVTLSEWYEYGSDRDGDHESVTLSEWHEYGSDRDGDHESVDLEEWHSYDSLSSI